MITVNPQKQAAIDARKAKEAEREQARKMPKVEAFKALTRLQVKQQVNDASNLAQLKDVVEVVALAVWADLNKD